ncbi:MAG: NIPSNAP family protein [Candidatus Hydrogenedentes bacterium]|nr:NIPSNAP family protein [Candidatus Hydrogenedentota bacterium]
MEETIMERRDFVAATGAVALAAGTGSRVADGATRSAGTVSFYEWREYHMLPGPKKNLLGNFLKNVEVPALNRLGIEPVGVFTSVFGGESLSIYMLVPYKSLDSFYMLSSRLAQDAKYMKDGAAVLDVPQSDPAYVCYENSLMAGFERMPNIVVPEPKSSRVFELRTYQSHSRKLGKKKIEMFNKAEIDIFLKCGLAPVFFGETLVGRNLPHLTYMLAFDELAVRDQVWSVFKKSPEWAELKSRPEYSGTVSNISVKILKPAKFSQI